MPFADYDSFEACVRANSDKDDPEAYCATIKRQVEGQAAEFDAADLDVLLETADAHAEEMLAEFFRAALVQQKLPDECRKCGAPDRMEGSMVCESCGDDDVDDAEQQASTFAVDVFRIMQAEDSDMDLDGDLMGAGVDFPNSGAYVDWNIGAWPDDEQLDEPHVSDYGSIEDLEQATGGVVEHLETIEAAIDAVVDGEGSAAPTDSQSSDE